MSKMDRPWTKGEWAARGEHVIKIDGTACAPPAAAARAGMELHRAIGVGDRVTHYNSVVARVVSVDGAWAWVKWLSFPDDNGCIRRLSDLTLAPEETP